MVYPGDHIKLFKSIIQITRRYQICESNNVFNSKIFIKW